MGGVAALPSGAGRDLLKLRIGPEGLQRIPIELEFVATSDDVDTTPVQLHFRVAQAEFMLSGPSSPCQGQAELFGRYGITGPMLRVGCISLTTSATGYHWELERTAVNGLLGQPFHVGMRMEDIVVETRLNLQSNLPPLIQDRLPNTDSVGPFTFVLGNEQHGVNIAAKKPFRPSNGAAAAYLFELSANGPAGSHVTVGLVGLPETWSAAYPRTLVLPREGNASFPVILGVPFAHSHGGEQQIRVVLTDMKDETTWGAAAMAIHWLDVAQPAGHHPTLFLHSAPGSDPLASATGRLDVWMSTVEDLSGQATEDPIPAANPGGLSERAGGLHRYTLPNVPLSPALQLGLSFRPEPAGMQVRVESPLAAQEVTVGGMIWHCDFNVRSAYAESPDCQTPFGYGLQTIIALGTIQGNVEAGMNSIDVPLTVPGPFLFTDSPNTNLFAMAWLNSSTPLDANPAAPLLFHPSQFLRLPLLEYQDPNATAFSTPEFRLEVATTASVPADGEFVLPAHVVSERDERVLVGYMGPYQEAFTEMELDAGDDFRLGARFTGLQANETFLGFVYAIGLDSGLVAGQQVVFFAAGESTSLGPKNEAPSGSVFLTLTFVLLAAVLQRGHSGRK